MSEFPTFPRARELSPEEAEALTQECFEIERRVKAAAAEGRQAGWKIAKAFYEFDEVVGWTVLGYETIGEWLAQPDLGFRKSLYYQYLRVYREIVVTRGLDLSLVRPAAPATQGDSPLEIDKVDIVLRSVTAGKALLEDAMDDVQSLSKSDLIEKYVRAGRVMPDPPAAEPVDGVDENQEEDPVIDAEVVPADEVVEVEIGHPATPQPDSLRQFDKTDLLEEWLHLRYSMMEAVENRETFPPSLPAQLIARGVSACDQILKAGGLDIGSRDV
jgi:hypothetical protein